MQIFVLLFEENDSLDTELFFTKEKAIEYVDGDLSDRYHFDTDEPDITIEELEKKKREMREAFDKFGYWTDDDVTYYLDEKTINE